MSRRAQRQARHGIGSSRICVSHPCSRHRAHRVHSSDSAFGCVARLASTCARLPHANPARPRVKLKALRVTFNYILRTYVCA